MKRRQSRTLTQMRRPRSRTDGSLSKRRRRSDRADLRTHAIRDPVPKYRPISEKIADSLSGLKKGWLHDSAIRSHAIFSVLGLIALAIARPHVAWVLAFVVLLVTGVAIELVNDAVERLLDRLHPDTDPAIGAAKDMTSAAAFVINAAAAVVLVCALLFARS